MSPGEVFLTDVDRQDFLRLHACCLMRTDSDQTSSPAWPRANRRPTHRPLPICQ